ncbi:hypothetical protein [Brachyspira aalborgi]|uniref:hypothetical protein n=1 Tax=Brachyspira aalborgi TaxID=29522 RepID=UPI0003A12CDA|nr:hypothetical protein [Brachyspira aalborgi]
MFNIFNKNKQSTENLNINNVSKSVDKLREIVKDFNNKNSNTNINNSNNTNSNNR